MFTCSRKEKKDLCLFFRSQNDIKFSQFALNLFDHVLNMFEFATYKFIVQWG